MKKTILTSVTALAFLTSAAQITITQLDMPLTADTIRVSVAGSIGNINPELTDTNYTWDYSTLIPDSQRVESFVACSSTPYPFFSFNSTYGSPNFNPDPIPFIIFGLTTSSEYNFYRKSSTKYEQTGFGVTVASIPAPIFYTQRDVIYAFPLNYGNKDSAQAAYNISIPNTGYYGRTIDRKNESDGWGTLITPKGTFQVLRLKSTLTITDTIHIDSLNFGIAFTRPTQYEFKYLGQNSKIPLLQVNATDLFGFTVVTGAIWQDDMYNELRATTASVKTCPNASEGTLTASASWGKPPYAYEWSNGQTTQTATGLSAGTYSVTIQDNYEREITLVDSVQSTGLSESCLNVPNAFTPNGDGTNDTWVIRNLAEFTNCKVQVFDRWGSRIYESTGYKAPWDGTYKGETVPAETYYYIIDLGIPAVNKYSGAITIVR